MDADEEALQQAEEVGPEGFSKVSGSSSTSSDNRDLVERLRKAGLTFEPRSREE